MNNAQNNGKLENPQAKAVNQSQKPRITDEDCAALVIFKDDNDLVLALRNLLMGFDLTDKEKFILEDRLDNDEVKRVIEKELYPESDPEAPLGQEIDLWRTTDITGSDENNFDLNYKVKTLFIGMIEKSLERLYDINKKGVNLTPKKDLAFLKARGSYMSHVTIILQDIIMNAHRSSGPSQENKLKNSNK